MAQRRHQPAGGIAGPTWFDLALLEERQLLAEKGDFSAARESWQRTARTANLTRSKATEDEVRRQCVTARRSSDTGMNAQIPTLRNVTRTRFRRGRSLCGGQEVCVIGENPSSVTYLDMHQCTTQCNSLYRYICINVPNMQSWCRWKGKSTNKPFTIRISDALREYLERARMCSQAAPATAYPHLMSRRCCSNRPRMTDWNIGPLLERAGILRVHKRCRLRTVLFSASEERHRYFVHSRGMAIAEGVV